MKELKSILGKNLTQLRKDNNMTQTDLAVKLNYTDKSVSKWEHGEATPPIEVLKAIADFYGVTVDYLLDEDPENNYDKTYNVQQNRVNKTLIPFLGASAIFFIATIFYIYSATLSQETKWIYFVYAVPVSLVVLLIFNCIWGKRPFTFILISAIIWTLLTSVYLSFIGNNPLSFLHLNPWPIFVACVPMQAAVILWSQLRPSSVKKRKHKRNKN